MGVLSKWFGGGKEEWPEQPLRRETGAALAFLCLQSNRLPNEEQFESEICKWLGVDSLSEFSFTSEGEGKVSITFTTENGPIFAMMMDAPVPEADIEYAAANSFHWPDAGEEMKKMTSHFIVTGMGEAESRAAQFLELSQVMAALSVMFDSVGIFWGNARIVHPPKFFQEVIADSNVDEVGDVPSILWVGYLFEPNEKSGFNLYSAGLSAFGNMEIEIEGSNKEASDAIDLVSGLAAYLIHSGNVIGDGETVGGSEAEKIRVSYAKSLIDHENPVLRLDY